VPSHVLRTECGQNIYLQCFRSCSNQVIPLTRAEKVKDLWVWFDENSSFKKHMHDKILN